MQVQNVSFGARYVKSATILKKNKKLDKFNVALVELNPTDIKDIACISKLCFEWGGIKTLTKAIMNNMNNIYFEESTRDSDRFFVITQQKSNYENLNTEDILSVAETSCIDDKIVCIDLLETNFKESHSALNANFKHIGTSMVNNIKTLFSGKDILIETPEKNEPFYTKLGFEKIKGGINRMLYKSPEI